MELSEIEVDPASIEQGEWVDNIPEMGDLRLKVRGDNNADWRRLQAKLLSAVPRQKRADGRIDPVEGDRVTSTLLRDAALLDWENLTIGGQAVLYSKASADTYLTKPEYHRFRSAVLWAVQQVGYRRIAETEEQEKNLSGASPGT